MSFCTFDAKLASRRCCCCCSSTPGRPLIQSVRPSGNRFFSSIGLSPSFSRLLCIPFVASDRPLSFRVAGRSGRITFKGVSDAAPIRIHIYIHIDTDPRVCGAMVVVVVYIGCSRTESCSPFINACIVGWRPLPQRWNRHQREGEGGELHCLLDCVRGGGCRVGVMYCRIWRKRIFSGRSIRNLAKIYYSAVHALYSRSSLMYIYVNNILGKYYDVLPAHANDNEFWWDILGCEKNILKDKARFFFFGNPYWQIKFSTSVFARGYLWQYQNVHSSNLMKNVLNSRDITWDVK